MAFTSNFLFLEKQWPVLTAIGKYAEKNLHRDSNTTIVKLRLFAEKTASFLINYERLSTFNNDKQADRLKRLKIRGCLPYEIDQIFHRIRKSGNKAVHEGYDSLSEAKLLLSFSLKLAAWFNEAYGKDPTFKAKEITCVYPIKVDRQAFMKRHKQLKADHEKALEELEAFKLAAPNNKSSKQRGAIASGLTLNEEETRQLIDQQLNQVGWEADSKLLKWPKTKPQKGKNIAVAEWPAGRKFVDYALFCGLKLVGFIEAKKSGKDVSQVLEEAKTYSAMATIKDHESFAGGPWDQYKIPFLFATNGRPYLKQLKTKSGIWFLDARKSTNISRPLQHWFSPDDLLEMLQQDLDNANQSLRDDSFDYLTDPDGLNLRDYQVEAIQAVEENIIRGKKKLLLAMATGTGKTRTAVGLIYRLIKSKRCKRVLFLVDRSCLGIQAQDAFKDNMVEGLKTFAKIYDLKEVAEKKKDDDTKVQIATVQGMVRRVLGASVSEAIPTVGSYDCIVVDEAHRGYILDKEMDEEDISFKNQDDYISKYRRLINYFDAVKIALTATPAAHTISIFGAPVYSYSYRQAVIEGMLTDHKPPVLIETQLKTNGIRWNVGETPLVYNTQKGTVEQGTVLEDELAIDIEGFNRKVITENFNRVVLEQLVNHIDPFDEGKTLIFAATDNHADLVVTLLKEAYVKEGLEIGDDCIMKITGDLKDQKGAISRFKNEDLPNIAVTVDLLTTGIDVPQITNLVFLRRVKSRILYEQMMGRATRKCDRIGKDFFHVYDAVGLYDALQECTDMLPVVKNHTTTFTTLVDEMTHIQDPQRLQRQVEAVIVKLRTRGRKVERSGHMESFRKRSGGRTPDEFINHIRHMPPTEAMKELQQYAPLFLFLDKGSFSTQLKYISQHEDSVVEVKRGYGKEQKKPGDYLEDFKAYIAANKDKIDALNIICTNPSQLTREDLKDIRLMLGEEGFTEETVKSAWKAVDKTAALADIITYIRNIALGVPVIDHQRRIRSAVDSVRQMADWNTAQGKWLDRIEAQLLKENTLQLRDFDREPFKSKGGLKRINRIFADRLSEVVETLNRCLYQTEPAA
ncbi:MAG: type I restriction-modification system endonuclease [bacterium]|nr:type I restriction-modification system endonuclease [bacterium]